MPKHEGVSLHHPTPMTVLWLNARFSTLPDTPNTLLPYDSLHSVTKERTIVAQIGFLKNVGCKLSLSKCYSLPIYPHISRQSY